MGGNFRSPFARVSPEQINVLREKVIGRDLDVPSVNPFRRAGQGILNRLTGGIVPRARPGPFDEFAFDEGEAGVAQRERFGEMSPLEQDLMKARTPDEFAAIVSNDALFEEPQSNGSDWQQATIYDPTAPTQGRRIWSNRVTGEQREIGPTMPGQETTMTAPDGTVFRVGRGTPGKSDDLTDKNRSDLQASVLTGRERIEQLDLIDDEATADPSLMTMPRKIQHKIDTWRAAWNISSPESDERIDAMEDFRFPANRLFVPQLREWAGAAMTAVEISLLTKALFDPEGLNPRSFMRRLSLMKKEVQDKVEYESYVLSHGLKWDRSGDTAFSPGFSQAQFKKVRVEEFERIWKENREANPDASDDEITDASLAQLNDLIHDGEGP